MASVSRIVFSASAAPQQERMSVVSVSRIISSTSASQHLLHRNDKDHRWMPVSKLIFATSAKCNEDDNKWSVYKQNYILNTYWAATTTAIGGVRSCPSGYPIAPRTKMIATEAVFATFELLEAILLSLPPLDLLLSIAVCRTWHQTIPNSTPLQQRLFFAPAPAETTRMQNPILTAKLWPIFHGFGCTGDFAEQL
ncbi:hypothetical protein V492_04781 [Pseudogymnoascus sp. VKM F-4246]|nr:hypothetical protein V492_04781 [Pseudogymnoascus sp. VKM F-4246]